MRDGHDFLKLAERFPEELFLLDEGDIYVKEHMMVFEDGTPKGLFALRKNKVIMFTATMPTYWLRTAC